jgi:hypothetical protein
VKNRFLLRLNNMTGDLYRRDFWRITGRDLAVVGYVVLIERSSIRSLWYLVRERRRLWRKRAAIQARVRVSGGAIRRWFR